MRWTRFFTIGSRTVCRQPAASGVPAARLERTLARLSGSQVILTLAYLAVLLGLVILYGRGNHFTTGFIYQAF